MELKHSFVIPAGLEKTWAHFQDISAVAECFPGAKVTSAEGDDFKGTAKVKLGPVALQYSGSGSFVERDEAAHRMVFEAKGRDKRGNGTAGATVTLSFAEVPEGTRADVETDLAVTGKPAQFGSRMMQEVSDKLLGQFVECLQQQVTGGEGAEGADPGVKDAAAAATGVAADDVAVEAASAEAAAGAAVDQASPAGDDAGDAPASPGPPEAGSVAVDRGGRDGAASDDALDLGATVLPVVARMYGKQIGGGLVLLVLLWLLRRRLSR